MSYQVFQNLKIFFHVSQLEFSLDEFYNFLTQSKVMESIIIATGTNEVKSGTRLNPVT
jgi:hypothetical protein